MVWKYLGTATRQELFFPFALNTDRRLILAFFSPRSLSLAIIMAGHCWMEALDRSHSTWGQKPFQQLSFPRSHDAGAYDIQWYSNLANKAVVVTQTRTIREQLEQGVRVFDIRPVKAPRHDWACGHGTDDTRVLSWQGGIGASIQQLVDDVNGFLEDKHEVILLDVSGTRLIDKERSCIAPYKSRFPTSQEWHGLLAIFEKLKHLYRRDQAARGEDLFKQYCFDDFKGRPAVLLVVDGFGDRQYLFDRGFWPSKSPNEKENNNFDPDCGLLVRMQSNREAVIAFLSRGGPYSVESLARKTQREMFPWLAQRSFHLLSPDQGTTLCCTISSDIIESLDLLTVSIAINHHRANMLQRKSELLIYCNAQQVHDSRILTDVQKAIDEGRWYDNNAQSLGAVSGPKAHGAVVTIYHQKGVFKGRYAKQGQRLHFEHDIMRVTYGDQDIEMRQDVYYNLLECNWHRKKFLVSGQALGVGPESADLRKNCTVEFRDWDTTETRTVSAYDGEYLNFGTWGETFGKLTPAKRFRWALQHK